jgi:hypothetical protein
MSCDELQRIWQSQEGAALNADQLAEALQQHDQSFNRIIFLRDLREIGVALVLIPIWIVMGVCRGAPAAGASLRAGIEYSLGQVEHQIWLLRNILWWYLLPLGIPIALFFIQVTVQVGERSQDPLWQTIVAAAGPMGVLIGVYGFIYWLNQYAVRKQLEPLRDRLQSALAGLTEEPPADSV